MSYKPVIFTSQCARGFRISDLFESSKTAIDDVKDIVMKDVNATSVKMLLTASPSTLITRPQHQLTASHNFSGLDTPTYLTPTPSRSPNLSRAAILPFSSHAPMQSTSRNFHIGVACGRKLSIESATTR